MENLYELRVLHNSEHVINIFVTIKYNRHTLTHVYLIYIH
jgi:hypothetical protein